MFKATSDILRARGITRPTALLDESRVRANIARMTTRAREAGAVFRPHFKTHQSGTVGRWFAEAGTTRITVSSLDMAEKFAAFGWDDITVAILHNPLETARAVRLGEVLDDRGGRLGLLVDDPRVAADLCGALRTPTDVWVKLDTGYGRTGVVWDDTAWLRDVIGACREPARVAGLLTHAGQSYHVRGREAVQAVYDDTIARLRLARDAAGRDELLLSLGDTPCCSLAADLSACDEIRPGNFVFYDLMQLEIGSCGEEDLAAGIACPVIAVYPDRQRIVIHGGAVHLSKESLSGPDKLPWYGCLGTVTADGFGEVRREARLVALSQEHGTVAFDHGVPDGLAPGDLVLVWPVHSCLSCDLLREQMAVPLTI